MPNDEEIEKAFNDLKVQIEFLFTAFEAGELHQVELEYNIHCAIFELRKALKLGSTFQHDEFVEVHL